MHDLILRNCQVVDGSGGPIFLSDIAVKDGTIAHVFPFIDDPASPEINVDGQYVAPGFIDIHQRGDASVFRPDFGEAQLRQGVTTTINGNCGMSIAPCPSGRRDEILGFLEPILGTLPPGIEFDSFSQYLERVSRLRLPINYGMHLGNGTLRMAVKGFASGKATQEEIEIAHAYLADAMMEGAFGISMGLAHAPESACEPDDVTAALEPAHGTGIPLVARVRSDSSMLVESLREAIAIAKRLEVPLHISHFKCAGSRNWGHLLREAVDLIEAEQAAGMSITCDVSPWLTDNSLLACILPPGYLEGGVTKAAERLKNVDQRRRCKEILSRPQTVFENRTLLPDWEDIMVESVKTDKNRDCEGKRLDEIAAMRGMDPADAALDLLAEEDCEVSMTHFLACEEDVETILRLPYSFIISGPVYPDGGGMQPRQCNAYLKILADYVRERRLLTLQEAVRKFTAAPAAHFRIPGKGMIREGYDADLVVFDLDAVECGVAAMDQRAAGSGFSHVLVNGRIANEHDSLVSAGAGRVLRRGR